MCDNKIFNVNGRGLDRLIQAFELGEWGRVGTAGIATLIAVKPAYLWYGK